MNTAADRLLKTDRVLVMAHRGDSRVAPENTLAAFESALDVGVDGVELDYRHSLDDEPVVFHDELLDTRTNARALFGGEKIPLAAKTLRELDRLDAGSWFDPKFSGERIPRLEAAIELIRRKSTPIIERKSGSAERCVKLLQDFKAVDQVAVMAFDWHFIAECRMRLPELVLVALGEDDLTEDLLKTAGNVGANVIGWNEQHLTPAAVALARRRGFRVWTWTVDDPERARKHVDAGVQGLITNTPAKIKEIFAAPPARSRFTKQRA